mgnify:CR=1 FL=1
MPKLVMVSVPRAFSHMTDYTITGGACFVSLSRIDIGALADYFHFKSSSDECFSLFHTEFGVFFLCVNPHSPNNLSPRSSVDTHFKRSILIHSSLCITRQHTN